MDLFFMAAMTVFALLFGGICVLLGVLLVGAGLATMRDTLAARRWPQVFATIESSTHMASGGWPFAFAASCTAAA